ncbi:MAG: hypothetical protein R3B57_01070 [Phycisphaerales bacterium]
MNAETIKAVLDGAKEHSARVAVGFANRSFFIKDITSVRDWPIDDDTLFMVKGQVYDTGHSRDYTAEVVHFQASDVVSLARPADA